MSHTDINQGRRRLLVAATSVVGAAGVAAVAAPFLASWSPSARALAAGAPVEVNVSNVEPGQLLRVVWRGKPIWIVNRTDEMLANLPKNDPNLRDPASAVAEQQPAYAQNAHRSRDPKYLVLVGICTHLGCSPYLPPRSLLPKIWARTGKAAGIAPATAHALTLRDACTKTYLLPPTWSCHRTTSKMKPPC